MPGISAISPTIAIPGATVTVTGVNLGGATAVSFGGTPAASFTVVSPTTITAVIGAGTPGDVSVVTPLGTAAFSGFTLALPPSITSFSPQFGSMGADITITGTNFTGVTAVSFGGVNATSFTLTSPTSIVAYVDSGASGNIAVTTAGGTATAPGFTYIGPTITSFSPASGNAGTSVTITGTNLNGTSAVSFGGVPAASFTITSATSINAVVSTGATGIVSVTTTYGTSQIGGFTFTGPTVASFSPLIGGPGTNVTLKGSNLTGVTAVSLGGSPAASYTIVDTATIIAIVGNGSSGPISVTSPKGTATGPVFIFTQVPVITSFSPPTGNVGTSLTITGANFSADPSADIVFLGSVRAVVSSATANTLVVTTTAGTTYQPPTVASNGLVAAANDPFITTFDGAGPAFTTNSFDGKLDVVVDTQPEGIVVCDFDGDGKPDLAAGGSNGVAVLHNTSSPAVLSFAPKQHFPGTYYPQFLATGDFDGDGKPDMVVADWSSTTSVVSVYKNTSTAGTISFAPKIDIPLSGANKILVYDMDGDGKPDLVVLNYFPANNISVLRNTTTGGVISFDSPVNFNSPTGGALKAAIADFDGDGKPDLALLNGSEVSILKNTSTPGFILLNLTANFNVGAGPLGMATGDLDGDGKPDLAFADPSASQESVHIFLNTGSPGSISFDGGTTFPAPANSGSWDVVFNDMDGDGKPDLVVTNSYAYSTSIYKNTSVRGTASFAPNVDYPTEAVPWLTQTGDLDGDGKPEFIVSNNLANTLSIFRNKIGAPNSAPSIRALGAVTLCQGDSVLLTSSTVTGDQWYLNNVAINGATGDTLIVNTAGAYTVTAASAGITTPPSNTITVTVNAIPPKPVVSLDSAGWLVSSADTGNQWYADTLSTISGATANIYQPQDSGYYSVKVTQNGCASPFAARYLFHLPNPKTDTTGSSNVIASPNPTTTGMVRITYNAPGTNGMRAELTNMAGTIILVEPDLQNNGVLDLSSLGRGIYVLRLIESNGKVFGTVSIVKL